MSVTPKSFQKHGTYIYEVADTVADYGSNKLTIEAMQVAGMDHAWVRIHSQKAYPPATKKIIAEFISDLKQAKINVAGWGWCQGVDAAADASLALGELKDYGLTDYVADIEQGVHNANWTVDEITTFCKAVRNKLQGGFGVTTFPLIDWHEPELMAAAVPFVDMFNPQIYWHAFPNAKMVREFKRADGRRYKANSAAEYVELCLDRWDALLGGHSKQIVVTGQAYWGEGDPPFTQSAAEDKLDEFASGWTDFGRLTGLNWWHFGGGRAMSHRMLDAITKARFGTRPYQQ